MFPSTGMVGGPGGSPFGLRPTRYKGESSNSKHATTKNSAVDAIVEGMFDRDRQERSKRWSMKIHHKYKRKLRPSNVFQLEAPESPRQASAW